jgi:fibronectin-binding autotransporter adhesin
MQGVRRGLRTIRAGLMAGVCLGTVNAHATDAIWSPTADNNNWNDGVNWVSNPPHTVPDGTATFGASGKTSIVFSSNFTAIDNINFSATAPLYTFAIAAGQGFVVNGTGTVNSLGAGGGIDNNSSFAPTFVVTGALAGISFNNFATASNANFTISSGGNLQFFNNAGAAAFITNSNGGSTSFFNNSSSSSPVHPGQAVFGSVIVNDSGGTTSFFDQTNAFGTVITNNDGGSTKFFNSSDAFNATITNNSNGATVFGSPFGGDIATAHSATIFNNSGGKTDFNASSTADHATITTISGGVTNFNDMSTADHATITNDGGGQTIFGHDSKGGSAQIINQNGGQTIFFGTAASATITNTSVGGTVFAVSGRAGSANITNTQLGGPGGGGTTQFFDSSTADHATITNSNSGSTSFFNSSMAGNATITNQNNAATSFADTSTADNATILNKLGGIVLFRGNSTAGNATITNDGGATTFIDNSCPGTATITAINGGFINYAQSGACPTPGPKPKIIVGQGSKIDISGLLISGLTFGSIEGLGTIFLGSKTLTVGTNDVSTVFGGVLADSGTSGGTGGSLVKVGNGTLILSGADTYTGPTNINAGILDVNGSLVSTVFVNSGGTLMGNGFIGGLVVGPGATVAPGNSIGTLTVNGNVSFLPGSFYQVEANAAGQSDKIIASGAATLAGGTVQVLAENQAYARQTRYTILTANAGVSGTFAGVTSNLAFLTPTLSYDPNDVFLTLNRNDTSFAAVAQTSNQRSVAGALDRSPLFSPLVQAVVNLTGASALRAFDALSGEIHGSVQTTMVDDSRYIRQAVLGRLRQAPYANGAGAMAALGTGGPMLAYADSFAAADSVLGYADAKKPAFPIKGPPLVAPAQTPDLTFWAQGVGAWGKINSDGNAADVGRNLAGFFTGFDRRFGGWRLGAAAGYTNSSLSVRARASSANIDTAYLAAYAATGFGAWNFRSGATFAWNTIGTSRSIVFPGFAEQASARYDAGEAQIFGEVGYGMTFGGIAAEPFAGLAWVHLDTRGFTETGGVSALTGTGNKDDVGYSTLGLRAATYYLLQNGMALIPRASVAWQHAFGAVTPTAALAFQSTGAGFGIASVPLARDAALIEAGGDLQLSAQAKIGVFYAGQLANSAHDHSVKGNFTWRF